MSAESGDILVNSWRKFFIEKFPGFTQDIHRGLRKAGEFLLFNSGGFLEINIGEVFVTFPENFYWPISENFLLSILEKFLLPINSKSLLSYPIYSVFSFRNISCESITIAYNTDSDSCQVPNNKCLNKIGSTIERGLLLALQL